MAGGCDGNYCRTMGYILAIFIGVLVVAIFALIAARNKRPKSGRISSDGQAILREEPSADEPTPGRSVTASPGEASRAEKRTPPA
jgi:hypothetical protein